MYNKFLLERSNTTFRYNITDDNYEVVKSRNGDLVKGGIYTKHFVNAYASVNPNVYIFDEREED